LEHMSSSAKQQVAWMDPGLVPVALQQIYGRNA
jgi:hypothetical protein